MIRSRRERGFFRVRTRPGQKVPDPTGSGSESITLKRIGKILWTRTTGTWRNTTTTTTQQWERHPQPHSNQKDRATSTILYQQQLQEKQRQGRKVTTSEIKSGSSKKFRTRFMIRILITVMRTCLYVNTTVVTAVGIAAAAPVLPLAHLTREKQELAQRLNKDRLSKAPVR